VAGGWLRAVLSASVGLLAAGSARAAPLDINVVFGGGLTVSQQTVFSQAEATWEGLITGYELGITLTEVTINAAGVAIDGVGGILGSAGPEFGTIQGGFILTTSGSMQFDTADLASLESGGQLEAVILHEMAHVLGLGTLWPLNGVYTSGTGQYTGAYGLAAYQTEFSQPGATYVPVELGGGGGTANGHWNEVNYGAGLTGITDGEGRDMRNELMTGWLNSPTFISQTTVQSFRDIGFTVVPEPSTALLLAAGLLTLGFARSGRGLLRRGSPGTPTEARLRRPRRRGSPYVCGTRSSNTATV